MKQYHQLLQDCLDNGRVKEDRTGTGTISLFGTQNRYNLLGEVPAITTKKLFFKGVIRELIWMIRGETNIAYLQQDNVKIWDEWVDEKGNLGPVYGEMWRKYPIARPINRGANSHTWSIDQLQQVIDELKTNPDSRRLIVSAWHPGLLPDTQFSPSENAAMGKQALPPCHTMFQFIAEPMNIAERQAQAPSADADAPNTHEELDALGVPKYYLSCQLYQRSADLFLGVPFNILSYSILTYLVASLVNMIPCEFIHTTGDAHIYLNHVEQVKEQLKRAHKTAPTLELAEVCQSYTSIDQFNPEDIKIVGYKSHPAIKAKVSV